ncbi:Nop domain-containing protein [Acaromyces ingoldii]|uniref:Nop domain-containing protein n=1 Tax=Acaromyces ingoldii TaxID=215250 RepID=A0A316YUZ6_9BASI|nr:Nop domain-containing protein [Acaromyces ingoldii]PWN92876.1 Nop domain-containing protein [Acaromyces ingoldii]
MASFADELLADFGSDGGASDGEASASQETGARVNGTNGRQNGHAGKGGGDKDDDENDGWGEMRDEDLDDLEGGDEDEEDGMAVDGEGQGGQRQLAKNAIRPTDEMTEDDVEKMDLGPENVESVSSVSKLMGSTKMRETLEAIEHYSSLSEPDISGILEESPEYRLIVRGNNLAVDVDNDIMVVHKFIRDHYAPRFPELESLIPNPWEFVQTVQAIGNDEEELSKVQLDKILPHGTVVVINMTAATSKGKKLDEAAWRRVDEACKVVFELEEARRKILNYVESRMTIIAPNLSAVVGTRVATKLLGISGGLTGLSKIPACNLILLGASRKAPTGFSTAHGGKPQGFIIQCPLIQNTPEEYHRQAARIVSAKAVLAARVDAGHSDRLGTYGARLAQELTQKLEKLQEPPPSKMTKALPVPQEGSGNKKRRGGRRARKAKEAMGMTELRKMQNRVKFGEAEEESGAFDEVIGLGMAGSSSNTGRIRAQAGEARSKAKMSKRNQTRLDQLRGGGGAGGLRLPDAAGGADDTSSGTASSLAFTPVQGIELVDPSRQKKVQEANAKWFQQGMFSLAPSVTKGGGASALPGSSTSNGSSMGPPSSLPANKKQKTSD